MDDETVVIILTILIAVLVVIGLIFGYFYRRWKRRSQQLQDIHRPGCRSVYQDVFSTNSSQEISGTHRSHVPEARRVYQDISPLSGLEHGRELPSSTRQQSDSSRRNYEHPSYANVMKLTQVAPARGGSSAQSQFSRGTSEDDPFRMDGWGHMQVSEPIVRGRPSPQRFDAVNELVELRVQIFNTAYYDHEHMKDSYESDSDSDSFDSIVQQAYEAKKSTGNEILRKIQNDLVLDKELNLAISVEESNIIIGVDATPHNIGGYFINLAQKRGEFYSFPVDKLPWTLTPIQNKAGNPAEFEMKNLIFALYLWKNELPQNSSKVIVFTDNFDYYKKQTPYGLRAHRFVRHLQNCEGIQIQVRVKGTNEADIEDHAKFVKPADDFSRKRFKEGRDFLVYYFGVTRDNLTGSHDPPLKGTHFKESTKAKEQLKRMKANHSTFKHMQCESCKFEEDSPSLHSVVIN
ncbi:uncharacterized protein LOC110860229 [Folsomia candida]|uniref:uncharacterized protein LOC110860229 n=1 Tax=Folsomia candida TaxID=158441 RepID=UPI0016050DE7|nr:uncharacterized protein LOC110860229 [Folsomia candida]